MPTAFQPDDELLSAYIDGQLSVQELRAVEDWLERDPSARTTVDELRSVSAMVQSLPPETLPSSWGPRLAERLDQQATRHRDSSGSSTPPISFGRTSRGWWYSAAAVAAAVAIVGYSQLNRQEANNDVAMKAPAAGAEVASAPADAAEAALASDELVADRSEAVPEMRAAPTEREPATGLMASDDSASGEFGYTPESSPPPLPAAAPQSGSERSIATLDATTASPPNTYFIVWADVPPAALRERQINRLLESNGIEIENRTDDWLAAAEPVRQQIELRNNRESDLGAAGGRAGGGLGGAGARRFSNPELRSETGGEENAAVGKPDDESAQRVAIEGETILVEATAYQIAACLADMQQDPANYAEITVEPVRPELLAEQLADKNRPDGNAQALEPQVAEGAFAELPQSTTPHAADQPGVQQRGRQSIAGRGGAVMQRAQLHSPTRARRLARPDQWYYRNTAPQDPSNAYQVRSKKDATATATAAAKGDNKQAQLDSINRLLQSQTTGTPDQLQPLTEQQPVQVLFVLRNSLLPATAAEVPASEAAPAESP